MGEEFISLPRCIGTCVGAKIEPLKLRLAFVADQLDARPFVLVADEEADKRFVIFEVSVVPGFVFFDEGVFNEKGFFFVFDHNGFNCVDLLNEVGDHRAGVAPFCKVLLDPLFELFGLADVDD